MSPNNRVFITGRSALTASGLTSEDTWDAILTGKIGIEPIRNWDVSSWKYGVAGELHDFQALKALPDKKWSKVVSRHDILGIRSAVMAVEDSDMLSYRSNLSSPDAFNEQTAIFVGSPGNKYVQQYDFLPLLAKTKGDVQGFAQHLFEEVHPMWLLRILPNNVLAYTGITYGFKGPNHNITNHAVGGAQAILEAYHALRSGQADRAIVVTYDVASEPQSLFYYEQLGVLSHTNLCPFDREHDGTILAEGAAALVLETEASVRERGAKCYAEVLGGLSASEGRGLFSIEEDGHALETLIARSLDFAGITPADVAFIAAHGNGNPKSDNSESKAIRAVFDKHFVPITAFKWSMGHTITASGVIDTVLTTYALGTKCVPGIGNFQRPSQASEGLNLSGEHQTISDNRHALMINRGFASMNACLVIKSCE